MAIRMTIINITVDNLKFIRIEVDYRVEEEVKTFALYNAIIEIRGVIFLVSPYPYTDEI